MDEQNVNNETAVEEEPVQPVTPIESEASSQADSPIFSTPGVESTETVAYASFLTRFLAGLIDGILIGIVVSILGSLFGFENSGEDFMSNPFSLLGIIYYVLMISKYGATLGKKAMGIRVQNEKTGSNLTIVEAILREVVGKFLSGVVFLLGYLWILWDPKKQAWHDKIAKSIVVKVK